MAALLHDVIDDTDATLEEVREAFGPHVADCVDNVSRLSEVNQMLRRHLRVQVPSLLPAREMLLGTHPFGAGFQQLQALRAALAIITAGAFCRCWPFPAGRPAACSSPSSCCSQSGRRQPGREAFCAAGRGAAPLNGA